MTLLACRPSRQSRFWTVTHNVAQDFRSKARSLFPALQGRRAGEVDPVLPEALQAM